MKNNFEISEKELKKFNWGALLMGWLWGIFNGTWITLIQLPLSYIPKIGWIFGLICAIVFGFKGNSWAYKNKKFENIEEFNKYQQKFIYAGVIMFIITFFVSWITLKGSALMQSGSPQTASCIIQLAIIAVISFFCFIIIYLINTKKVIKLLLTLGVIILVIIFGTLPVLNGLSLRALQQNEYNEAARIYKIMATLSINPVNKNKFYNLTAACYIETKDINNIIKYFEKAENADKININPESSMLTDLYIIKGDIQKVKQRDDRYKLYALNSDWEKVIDETTPEVENPRKGVAINGEIYAHWDYYLARAIAYRNLGNLKEAENNLDSALKTSSPAQAEYINNAFKNYKRYFKDYFEQIKIALDVK